MTRSSLLQTIFFFDARSLRCPPGLFQKEDSFSLRRWRQVQYLEDIFWKRWSKEYLPPLQSMQKWTTIRKNLAVGILF